MFQNKSIHLLEQTWAQKICFILKVIKKVENSPKKSGRLGSSHKSNNLQLGIVGEHNTAQEFYLHPQISNNFPQMMSKAIVGGSWGKMLKLGFKTQFQGKRLWLCEICWKFAVFDLAFLIEYIDSKLWYGFR